MRIFISTLLITLVLLSACTHKQKDYTDLVGSWQEKAQNTRTKPIQQKKKVLKREKIVSTDQEKDLVDDKLPKKNISVKYYQQDLSTVLRSLGKLAGLNLIVDDSLSQKVTMEINDSSWVQVFKGILEGYSLEYVYENNIVRIITPDSIKKRLEAETIKEQLNQAKQRVQKSSPLLMRTIKLDHLDIDNTATMMRKILSEEKSGTDKEFRGSVETDKTTNTVIINAVAADINKMLDLIERLDKPAVQVLIEAQIVLADQSTARELGMQWGGLFKMNDHSWVIPGDDQSGLLGGPLGAGAAPNSGSISNFPIQSNSQGVGSGIINQGPSNGLNIGIGYVDSNMILQAQLSALEEAGQAHIVSSPTITTLNNIQAYIESGREIPYQSSSDNTGTNTEFKKAVLRLDVTPHVVDHTLVKLEVMASNDEPDRTIVNSDLEPAIITRKTQTTVLLQHGQTTVIAGLSKEFVSEGDSGIPVLKDLPYLGAMFRSTLDEVELSDLLIFITPYIIDPENEDLYPENELLKDDDAEEGKPSEVELAPMAEETAVVTPVETPEVVVPLEEASVPEVAEVSTTVEIPTVEAPQAEVQEMPAVEVPEVEAPETPEVEVQEVPAVEAPKAEVLEMPVVEAPEVESLETPAVEAPEVESLETPAVEAPEAEVMETTEVVAPEAEVVEMPAVETPEAEVMETPAVEAPEMDEAVETVAEMDEPELVEPVSGAEATETVIPVEDTPEVAYPSSPNQEAEGTDIVEGVTETTESMEGVETE